MLGAAESAEIVLDTRLVCNEDSLCTTSVKSEGDDIVGGKNKSELDIKVACDGISVRATSVEDERSNVGEANSATALISVLLVGDAPFTDV